jgi:hypothetical protein
MKGTYKAVEVSTPGVLRVVERPVLAPKAGIHTKNRIRARLPSGNTSTIA